MKSQEYPQICQLIITINWQILIDGIHFVNKKSCWGMPYICLIVELWRAKCACGAPWVRKCGKLPIRENLVITWPYTDRLSVCMCVCVHPLNKDIPQAIIVSFFQCVLQKIVGWVALSFVIALCRSWNHLECDGQCLFLSYCNSCSAGEMSFLTRKECPRKRAHCRSTCQKNMYVPVYSLGQLERL